MIPENLAAVIFDLDGTLVDSAPDIRRVANRVLAEAGRPPLTLAETRRFVGAGADTFVTRMAAARDLPSDAAGRAPLLERFLGLYEGAVEETVLYPGVSDALALLAARGLRLGLCTNKPEAPTRALLAHFGMGATFGAVVGGDSLPVRKPDPAPLRAVHDALGAGPALYVGDSEIDAETAERAGLPFGLFTEGYRTAPVETLRHSFAFDHWDRFLSHLAPTLRSA